MSLDKKRTKPWLRFCIALILALITAEIVTRAFIVSPSRQLYDAELGYRWKPNSWHFNAIEGGAYNRINNIGLFDDDLPIPGRSRKIAVLGDSFVESLQLPQKYNFTSLLEEKWQEANFINGGHGGFNPSHYPYVLKRILTKTNVDLTILFLHPGEITGLVTNRTNIIRDDNNMIVDITPKLEANTGLKKIVDPFILRSAFIYHFFRQIKPVFDNLKQNIKTLASPKDQNIEENKNPSADVKTLISELGVERFKIVLQKLKALSNNNLIIVYFDEISYGLNATTKRANDLNEDEIYKLTGLSLNVPVFDISDSLTNYYHKTHQPPFGFHNTSLTDGHLNRAGHQVVADAIASIITNNFPEFEVNNK